MKNSELYFVRGMFDGIAFRYDLLNRLLSLRRDIYWRNRMVSEIKKCSKANILDIACGTGDVIVELIRQKGVSIDVTGVDFSENMLAKAQKKINKVSSLDIKLVAADVLFLPFISKSFDVITVAFGIRNVKDRLAALKIFFRLLKPNGVLVILELSTPNRSFVGKAFMYYFERILPKIGELFSKNNFAYNYLAESVIKFPNSSDFALMVIEAGFSKVSHKRLTMGIANLFVGHKC